MSNQSPAEALRQLEEIIGPRCETSDKTDFPDTDYSDPKNSRCFGCEVWEAIDAYAATVEREAGEQSLNLWKGWLAYVESGGGHINRRQITDMIAELEERLAALQGPRDENITDKENES